MQRAPRLVCGIDEVGRGSLAGPLMAVAAVFDLNGGSAYLTYENRYICPIEGVQDSKKYPHESAREIVFHRILRYPLLLSFGVGWVESWEIDEMKIDPANQLAFQRAMADLEVRPEFTFVDGVHAIEGLHGQQVEPKADGIYWPVAAASVLAKVIRDEHMTYLGRSFPEYDWGHNMGYGTPRHQEALRVRGATKHHRRQFIRKMLGGTP